MISDRLQALLHAPPEQTRNPHACSNLDRSLAPQVMWHAAELANSLRYFPEYGLGVVPALTGEGKPPVAVVDLAHLKAARDAYVERLNGIYRCVPG